MVAISGSETAAVLTMTAHMARAGAALQQETPFALIDRFPIIKRHTDTKCILCA
jgi:hypothetical protein